MSKDASSRPAVMSVIVMCLCMLAISVMPGFVKQAPAAQGKLQWDSSIGPNAAAYKVHYGTTTGSYASSVNVGNVTSYTLTGLQDGTTYYCAVTALNTSGQESVYSNEVTVTTPPAPACTYSIAPTGLSLSASGGTGAITVTASSGCSWSASSGASWVTIASGGTGTGNGTVNYTVSSNSGAARSAALTIGGSVFTVSQAAASSATMYVITSSAGYGGSISPSGSVSVAQGSNKTFTITPRSGYRIGSVKVNGVSRGALSSFTFINVGRNHTIQATFYRRW